MLSLDSRAVGTRQARAPLAGRITAGQTGWPTAREIERRRATYGLLLDRAELALRSGDLDHALLSAHAAAQLAYHYHFGLWVDPRIERLARDAGAEIAASLPGSTENEQSPHPERMVHLASVLKDAGGHTEVIRQWVAAIGETRREQYVVSSELQDSRALGAAALAAVEASSASVALCPPGLAASGRARWLAGRLLELRPGAVILHIDPADVFAVAAIHAARRYASFKIYFYNHSDHTFSVGVELAQRVFHSRVEAVGHSIRHRGVAAQHARYAPLTIDPVGEAGVERASLGVPAGVTLSISAANFYKTVPDDHWSFGEILGELLEAEPNHHHLLVGGGVRRHKWHLVRALARRSQDVRSRVHWLGTRRDLPALFGAADFLIDSAPLSGSTIRIQAMAAGLPIVATHHASNPLMSWTSAFYDGYPLIATSNEDVVRLARDLIHQPELRAEVGRDLAELHATQFSAALLGSTLDSLLGADDEHSPETAAEGDYDLYKLAGLSGPVPSAHALVRRARGWLGGPGAGARNTLLRRADQAVAAFRGVGRS